jgi:nonribosomal peptide synthetase DhbF
VLKAGGAYVPIDPEYPGDRIAYMVRDAAPVVVLTTVASGGVLPPDVPKLALDETELAGWDETALTQDERIGALLAEHPAYVIYTSGSTGRPKGVVVTHRSIADLCDRHRDSVYGTPGSRVALTTSVSFDASWNQLAALFGGH